MSVTSLVIRAAEEGGDTPSVLGTPLDEVILGTVAFFIVLVALAKFALPSIRTALDERTATIEGGVERAEAMQAEARQLMAAYQAQIGGAHEEAAQIRAKAEADAKTIIAEARAEAEAERAAIAQRGAAQLEAERIQTVASLRQDVGGLAVDLAGRIVGETLSDDARARSVVDSFIAGLEQQATAKESI